eukprot:CAMPEP_0172442876 /NCGR_PEP_ID=MMETSP1065-20121228/3242_1 /TAXON_ID=265537 /ORGANISM="Amphiprora paludosa, Strain CCMP125" /LENGTH=397 /DNA_ID=CAMNT_0013192921 /DNA_START=186 /DNA_END=1379 /DNA_ORIENTATION=-
MATRSRRAIRRDSMDSKASTASTETGARGERIPALLQAVFIQSNRGKEVNRPPPGNVADRVFFRNWTSRNWFWRRGQKNKKNKMKSYEPTLDEKSNKVEPQAPATPLAVAAVAAKNEAATDDYSLQEYFDALLEERGYKVQIFETLKTGYYTKATPMQIASYGPHMIQLVRQADVPTLRETMKAGLSPNPSNQFGESLLHMICRHGSEELIDVLIEAGASLQVSDDYGRTPLNDAFWAARPAFEVVSRILDKDCGMLFLKDKRGSLPLQYVRKSEWGVWRDWFDENIDKYFPEEGAKSFSPPELASLEPNSVTLPEAKATGLPLDLVKMIANGNMSPAEARTLAQSLQHEDQTEVSDSDDSSFDSDFDSEDGSVYDDLEQDEMMEILQMAQLHKSTV